MKPFTEQHDRQLRRIVFFFTNILEYLSGGEPAALLKHYLIKNPEINLAMNSSIRGVVSSMQRLHSNCKKRDKNKILSVVAPHFSAPFLKSHGFKFCASSFSRARKGTVFENKTFMPRSKKPITAHQKRKLEDFLLENSTIASNKVKRMRLSEYMGHRRGK